MYTYNLFPFISRFTAVNLTENLLKNISLLFFFKYLLQNYISNFNQKYSLLQQMLINIAFVLLNKRYNRKNCLSKKHYKNISI